MINIVLGLTELPLGGMGFEVMFNGSKVNLYLVIGTYDKELEQGTKNNNNKIIDNKQ